MELVALAIPVFLVAIVVEWWLARGRGRTIYGVFDTLANLGCGISSQLVAVYVQLWTLGLYSFVLDSAALCRWPTGSPWPWVIAFFGVDPGYYAWHRASHRVNFMWAMHVVHHQSEQYNLSVALRQASLTGLTQIFFYLPMALLGVPTQVFVVSLGISLAYQFWIHTRLVDRWGMLENWLSTPSHHRVHHGVNPEYIDRNHGAILIIWDRLFGTFAREHAPVVFGTTQSFTSWNPLWANTHRWVELWRMHQKLSTPSARVRLWFGPPELMVDAQGRLAKATELGRVEAGRAHLFEAARANRSIAGYLALQLTMSLPLVMAFLLTASNWPGLYALGFIGVMVLATAAWGTWANARIWPRRAEALRVVATALFLSFVLLRTPELNTGFLGVLLWCFGVLGPVLVGILGLRMHSGLARGR